MIFDIRLFLNRSTKTNKIISKKNLLNNLLIRTSYENNNGNNGNNNGNIIVQKYVFNIAK